MTDIKAEVRQALLEILGRGEELGFVNPPVPLWVYPNRSNPPHLWYAVRDKQIIELPTNAICGYVRDMTFEKVTKNKAGEVTKLRVTLEGDRLYILEMGHDTHFAKGLMMALSALTGPELEKPITISVTGGEDDSVVFCRVYKGRDRVDSRYDENTDWRDVAKRAIANVKQANLKSE